MTSSTANLDQSADNHDRQWGAWTAALAGEPIPTERGNPASGYFKRNTDKPAPRDVEIVCIYRDGGKLQCLRSVYGDGSKMDPGAIDDLFGEVCMYPVPYDAWEIAESRGPWPPEYRTRLTLEEQKAGAVWTVALGRKKAAPGVMLAENERAVIGDNSGDREPHELLLARVNDLEDKRREWLRTIGGAITTQDHADKAADFKTAFAALEKEATDEHRDRKKPHLDAGRVVDKTWKPIIDLAEKQRKATTALTDAFLRAQAEANRKAAADANRLAREAEHAAARPQQASGDTAGQATIAAAAPIFTPVPVRAGSGRGIALRTETRCIVTDLPALAAALAAMDPPFPEWADCCRRAANTVLRRGDTIAGAKLETSEVAR